MKHIKKDTKMDSTSSLSSESSESSSDIFDDIPNNIEQPVLKQPVTTNECWTYGPGWIHNSGEWDNKKIDNNITVELIKKASSEHINNLLCRNMTVALITENPPRSNLLASMIQALSTQTTFTGIEGKLNNLLLSKSIFYENIYNLTELELVTTINNTTKITPELQAVMHDYKILSLKLKAIKDILLAE